MDRMERRRRLLAMVKRPTPWWQRYLERTNHLSAQFWEWICRSIIHPLWTATGSRWLFLKCSVDPQVEVASLRFIHRNTHISVPRVWFTIRIPWNDLSYVVMQRLPGFPLDDPDQGWDSFDDKKKARIYAQLRMFISELRALPPPASPAICSILRGPVLDHRLCKDAPYGPYPDEAEMNRQLRAGADLARYHNLNPRVVEAHSIRHPLVFTHGDLAMRNIMVEGDVVTGIIDWECAGWFPAHWEYVKARFACVLAYEKAWKEGVAEFVPPYPVEADADYWLEGRLWPLGRCL